MRTAWHLSPHTFKQLLAVIRPCLPERRSAHAQSQIPTADSCSTLHIVCHGLHAPAAQFSGCYTHSAHICTWQACTGTCRSTTVPQSLRSKAAKHHIDILEHSDDTVEPDFTHFITAGALLLSLHALLALADARPIVSRQWLDQSVAAGVPLDATGFLVADAKAEKAHKFSYQSSFAAARKQRLLAGVLSPRRNLRVHVAEEKGHVQIAFCACVL